MSVTKIEGQTETRPMRKTNAGANLMLALRTTIVCDPMSEANVSISFSDIVLILAFVRRANIRYNQTNNKKYLLRPENS